MLINGTPLHCLLALILAGCASYQPSTTSVPVVAADAARISEKGITLAAEPCIDPDLQLSLFDADFNEAGIIAINVVVRNERDHTVIARRTRYEPRATQRPTNPTG